MTFVFRVLAIALVALFNTTTKAEMLMCPPEGFPVICARLDGIAIPQLMGEGKGFDRFGQWGGILNAERILTRWGIVPFNAPRSRAEILATWYGQTGLPTILRVSEIDPRNGVPTRWTEKINGVEWAIYKDAYDTSFGKRVFLFALPNVEYPPIWVIMNDHRGHTPNLQEKLVQFLTTSLPPIPINKSHIVAAR